MANLYQTNDFEKRPWGEWKVLWVGPCFCVKQIRVNPQGVLSLQLHHHRQEHWVIVEGTAMVTLDEKQFEVHVNDTVYIKQETKHRIENQSNQPVVFIEIQTGDYLDENDIVRFEDIYGRC